MEEKKLGFGFMCLPLLNENDQTSIDYPQLIRMTDTFMAQGFTYFDTAYMYHDFICEKVVNEVVVKRYPRDSFTIASKMPTMLLNAAGIRYVSSQNSCKRPAWHTLTIICFMT